MSFNDFHIGMPVPLQELFDSLMAKLDKSRNDHPNIILHCQHSIIFIKSSIERLKEYVVANPFQSKEEEITFFKFVKPKFYAQFIYYAKVFKIESNRPTGSYDTEKSYLMKELDKLSLFFDNNTGFYAYYRSGASFMDEKYFLRTESDINLLLDSACLDADPLFTSPHDYMVAKIMANNMLSNYLNRELTRKDNTTNFFPDEEGASELVWTDSNTALIELSYALKYAGCFNHGKADVKQIITFFQKSFNVKLGNTSKVFQEIISRKSGYTTFLHKLTEKLVAYIQSIV